ncbi:hypothetical protein B1C78_06580 [Thioalkalivibrio denitrificans]|uniref:ABC transporter substrate-binding protein n=1 Tax=Thioalkalivibrio denitrificans TaxID=108003 RepID=A0A1V3NKV3_9GAMM|nr:DUF1007 family protein [Thioalkalivibrio denitrificans]OOG25573.1 hypothetical protein B1C78_06580 [Thioalkalivibrio denitrificans]
MNRSVVARSVFVPGTRALLLGLLWLLAPAVHAHPHAWIDLRVSVIFDAQGHVTALRQAWLIDPFYSLVLMEEMAEDAIGDTLEEKMEDIGTRMITNLGPYDYFTEIRHGDTRIRGATASDHRLDRNRGRLELSFTLNLEKPLDPVADTFEYAVFDPSYFIEILHDDNAAVALEGASESCSLRIIEPRPDPAMIARAAALDVNQTAEPGLGRHFTERTEIRCEP